MSRTEDTLLGTWVEDTVREVQRLQSELQDVEAKRAAQDLPKRLYKTFSAFGNREGGGIILLGVDEANGFTVSGVEDVARAQHDLINFVQNEMSYPLRLETTIAEVDGRVVVAVKVMEAPFSQKPVFYKNLGLDRGSYHRSGTSNVQMTHEQVRQLIAAQVEGREDFTARLVATLPAEWYDPLEIERMRRVLRVARRGSDLDVLPAEELLLKLQLAETAGAKNVPTIAGLLLVGREAYIRQHVTEHEVIFLRHPGDTEEYEARADAKRPLVALLEEVEGYLQPGKEFVPIQAGLIRVEIPRFHREVCREALLNAFIHRNYADYGSVLIREYPDRLEIANPGGFLPGIGPHNILSGTPKHRNRRLAEAFQLLGLVERAGMGVRKMYRHQLENGKMPPEFTATESEVRLSVPTAHIDQKLAVCISNQYRAGHRFDVADLLVLNRLRMEPEIRTAEVAKLTQRNQRSAAAHLNEMVARDLLRRRGTGAGTTYAYSPALQRELGIARQAARDAGVESIRHPEMIFQYIRQHGRIANRDCQVLCDLSLSQASKLLRRLVREGVLEQQGPSRKFTYYVLPSCDA
jgi:ATP-dependent DNA helicase RecG